MSNTTPTNPKIDRYVVIHVATTCDEHGVYVTKDSAEVIEIGWMLLDSKTLAEVSEKHKCYLVREASANHLLQQLYSNSVLVKPVNTPITPLCSKPTTIAQATRTIEIR